MKALTSNDLAGLGAYRARILRRRARDPYFDGLCLAYQDVGNQLETARQKDSGINQAEVVRLENQRIGFFNTILFLLDDHDVISKYAA
jgi:uncharacterized protein YdcH (DUF465 family)